MYAHLHFNDYKITFIINVVVNNLDHTHTHTTHKHTHTHIF